MLYGEVIRALKIVVTGATKVWEERRGKAMRLLRLRSGEKKS